MMNKNVATRSCLLPISLIFIGILISCENDKNPEMNVELQKATFKIDSLSSEIEGLKLKSDSLQTLVNEKHMFAKSDTVYFGKDFENIQNPVKYIKNTLKEQPEIIPLKPVLGGEMQFRKITILSNTWLYTMYDDGHVQGASLIEYGLDPEGSLQFNVLLSEKQ